MKSIKTWGKHKYKAGRFLFCRLICLIISFLSAWFLWTEDKYSRWKYCLSSGKNVFFWLRYLTNDLFLRVSFLISRIPRFSLRLTRSNKRKIYRNFFSILCLFHLQIIHMTWVFTIFLSFFILLFIASLSMMNLAKKIWVKENIFNFDLIYSFCIFHI